MSKLKGEKTSFEFAKKNWFSSIDTNIKILTQFSTNCANRLWMIISNWVQP